MWRAVQSWTIQPLGPGPGSGPEPVSLKKESLTALYPLTGLKKMLYTSSPKKPVN